MFVVKLKHTKMETWKSVKGYEGLYLVSNLGRIKSLPKKTRNSEKILKPISIGPNGYTTIDLVKDKKIVKTLIHRIVAIAFIPNIENKEQVNHKNGIKYDNKVENLEWNTRSENQLHSISSGLRTTKGEKNSQSKLYPSEVNSIFTDKRKYKEISLEYGVSVPTISDIKRGYSWSHVTGLLNMKKQ